MPTNLSALCGVRFVQVHACLSLSAAFAPPCYSCGLSFFLCVSLDAIKQMRSVLISLRHLFRHLLFLRTCSSSGKMYHCQGLWGIWPV
jgi:hypothetical protein